MERHTFFFRQNQPREFNIQYDIIGDSLDNLPFPRTHLLGACCTILTAPPTSRRSSRGIFIARTACLPYVIHCNMRPYIYSLRRFQGRPLSSNTAETPKRGYMTPRDKLWLDVPAIVSIYWSNVKT